MISISEATEIIRENLPAPHTTTINISGAHGRILAEDVLSPEPLPRFTNSAMDGYAVLWSDIESAEKDTTVSLAVIGESRAGAPVDAEVSSGEAVRINTGAMIPEGADSVIPVEDVTEEKERISINSSLQHRQYIRFAGEELKPGEVLLDRGNSITPPALGLLTSAGVGSVSVFEKPEVAVIVTGSELADSEREIMPWQIRDSNQVMLSTSIELSGGRVIYAAHCGDNLSDTQESIRQAGDMARIVLVSGGVSVGPHDVVKEAAEAEGFKQLFWKVRQKPGKPLYFARRDQTLLFGLPGNPVSALICFVYYINPLLQHAVGGEYTWNVKRGRAGRRMENTGERTLFLRTRHTVIEDGSIDIHPLEKQGSHMISSVTMADGFVLLETGQVVDIGEEMSIYIYPWRRGL
jgi:molybdopterin molybdotransferase